MCGELGVCSQAVSEIEHLGSNQAPTAQAFHLLYKDLNTFFTSRFIYC